MIIGELMVKIIASVPLGSPLSTIISTMSQRSISCVPVHENGKPVGIITERDIVRLFAAHSLAPLDPTSMPASEVMTRDPICVKQSTPFSEALLLAKTHNFRHILVVDDNDKLVGLVTQTDMINTYVGLMERQIELENANQELELLSYEDPLMKIGNRRAMEVELDFMESLVKRYEKFYSIALIDIDYFKKYNDLYGHQSGDLALKAVAETLTSAIRETDKLYRYGGEELLLLLPETSHAEATVGAERARVAIETANIAHDPSPFGHLTVSIGVAMDRQGNWPGVLKAADQALYHAKANGRNQVSDTLADT